MTRVAVVTGGTGMGGEVGGSGSTPLAGALRLAEHGFAVAVIGNDPARADDAVQRIGRAGGRCIAVAADPGSTASFDAALEEVCSSLGEPAVLLNSVALGCGQADGPTGEARFSAIRGNLRTLLVPCRSVSRQMLRKRWGRIINVADAVDQGRPEWRNGQAVLAGLIGFTRSAALELGGFGITANFIAPASCSPEGRRPAHQMLPGTGEPLSYPDAAAGIAAFLVTDQAAAVTGQGCYAG